MQVDRLLHVCSVGRMLRGSCSDSHRSILLAKRPSTVLRSNIPLQSTLTPCVVWSIHAGKSMLTNPDKQASRNRGPVHKKTRWTRKIQRKAFLIDYSPSQLIWRTWRRMCSHIPLKERTQIRKVMLRKWRHKNWSTIFILTSPKNERDLFQEQKVWWIDNSRAPNPQRWKWISEQSPVRRGTGSRHSVDTIISA